MHSWLMRKLEAVIATVSDSERASGRSGLLWQIAKNIHRAKRRSFDNQFSIKHKELFEEICLRYCSCLNSNFVGARAGIAGQNPTNFTPFSLPAGTAAAALAALTERKRRRENISRSQYILLTSENIRQRGFRMEILTRIMDAMYICTSKTSTASGHGRGYSKIPLDKADFSYLRRVTLAGLMTLGQALKSPSLNLTLTRCDKGLGKCGILSSVWSQAGPRRAPVRAARAAMPQSRPQRVILRPPPLPPPPPPPLPGSPSPSEQHILSSSFALSVTVAAKAVAQVAAVEAQDILNKPRICPPLADGEREQGELQLLLHNERERESRVAPATSKVCKGCESLFMYVSVSLCAYDREATAAVTATIMMKKKDRKKRKRRKNKSSALNLIEGSRLGYLHFGKTCARASCATKARTQPAAALETSRATASHKLPRPNV
ncbi:unnamed protein product [Trichogramma brassicae]|uniref:Uncharacterized protein n=1 Tax=Trichogramma brassicae TaxID=86971 RepID=A0A6H5ITZ0_9HYME|nr:unnamed protein product [Trichogramma brassicae]